jgi:hypothetical protein
LHKILHEIELLLLTEPASYEAKELKSQITQAIKNDMNHPPPMTGIAYRQTTTPQTPWRSILIVAFIVAAALNSDTIAISVISAISFIINYLK